MRKKIEQKKQKKIKIISAKRAVTPAAKELEKAGIIVHETVMSIDGFMDIFCPIEEEKKETSR